MGKMPKKLRISQYPRKGFGWFHRCCREKPDSTGTQLERTLTVLVTNQEKVHWFLKENRNTAYCDECIANATKVNPFEVTLTTSAMRMFPQEFAQRKGVCPECHADGKTLTSAT